MRWHAEWFLSVILALRLIWYPDGRRWFEGLICCNLLMEFAQMGAERFGFTAEAAQVWYIGRVLEGILIIPAILEASALGRKRHFWILAVWIAATMECAWLRFYPFTGAVLIAVNTAAYVAWLADSTLSPLSKSSRAASASGNARAIDRIAVSHSDMLPKE